VKRIGFCILLGLLFTLAASRFIAVSGEYAMNNTAFALDRPPIDRAIPAKLETATFALG